MASILTSFLQFTSSCIWNLIDYLLLNIKSQNVSDYLIFDQMDHHLCIFKAKGILFVLTGLITFPFFFFSSFLFVSLYFEQYLDHVMQKVGKRKITKYT